MHLPPSPFMIDPNLDKRARYNPDLLPADFYVASENSVGTLITPSDSLDLIPYDNTNILHVKNKDLTFLGRVKR